MEATVAYFCFNVNITFSVLRLHMLIPIFRKYMSFNPNMFLALY